MLLNIRDLFASYYKIILFVIKSTHLLNIIGINVFMQNDILLYSKYTRNGKINITNQVTNRKLK